jgi:AP-4 complex subunit epsilon-1
LQRIGYLATSLLLHENHELVLLTIASIKKDLDSDNQLNICAALITISKLISAEYIPAVLPRVRLYAV